MEIDPQHFFGDLTTCSKDEKRGPYQCQRLLETLYRNLIEEQINSSFIDLYLIHIFEKSNGLIYFIETTINKKSFHKATTKAVEILYTLVNNFPARLVESNILNVYTLCISAIKCNALAEVKVKILELLLVCLEKLDICVESEDVSSIYKQLLSSLQNAIRQNHSDSVKHKELVVLGFFAKRYQYLISNPKEIQLLFVRSFEPEVLKPKKSQNIICGFFTGFSDYCESYPLNSNSNDDKKLIEKLYKFIKVLVVPTDRIKTGNRAAILFLSKNTKEFGELLLKEYKFWHSKLLKWLEMGADDQKAGVKTIKAFLHVTSTVLYEKSEGDWRSVIEYFNQWSKYILQKGSATNHEKHLALFCLRSYSGASFKHLPQNEVTDLFVMIMQTFEYCYILNYNPSSEEWEYLPDYVQTVANFMQFKTFTASEFYCLQRAVINMIKSFHQLPYLHYGLVIDGIVTSCFYLKKSQYFDAFVENIIYQGVVWSCSYQHISNAEFEEETTEKIITVKNFFPLWEGILKLTSNRSYDKYGLYLEDRKYILERIVNQLVKTLMILINKLNLSVKLRDEDISLTEVEKAYQVEQTDDYAIFLNLIDFYREILNYIEPRMFKKCICKIIKHIINKCVKYPLISGFYKLLSYALKIANKLNLFREQDDINQDIANARETLTTFLEILLEKMIQYKDELLIACLQVLLECPIIIVKHMLTACVIPFITVFNVGRSYLPLAEMGLNTLEYWQDSMNSDDLDPLLSKIVSSLDTYLRSKSLQGQTQANVTEKRRKTAQTLKKRKVLLELEPQLVKIQKRILTFIGKQTSKVCQAFVYCDNSDAPAKIRGENFHLKITLPYEDVHLDIYLDTFVPRVVNLALYCSDRKTRITACEVLQATVMIFLGRAKPMSHTGLTELEDLLKTIAMPLLQLGCDIDQLVQQIFEPLFLQLIHWYTSPTQLRGSHTAIVIDVLMEGITHPTDSCLRDFSGKCINEFIKWTIKQSNDAVLSKDPANIKVLVKKMRFFSSHPDSAKKLGAALIFNNIYREFREEEWLISMFWLEILHIFVTSLALIEYNSLEDNSTVIQINNALRHLQRVFVEKPQLFRTDDAKRRVPSDIKGSILKDVAVWLLQQTGNRSRNCRESCMELFITIAPLVSDKKVNLQVFVRDNFSEDFVSNIYEQSILKNPTLADLIHTEDCTILLKWLREFLCALDGYNFVIKNNLREVNFVNSVTFIAVNYFLKNVYNVDMPEALNLISHKSWTFTSLDREQFNKLRSACVISILKLYNTIINDEILCKKSDKMWTVDFWMLILNTIFCPHLLGLDDRVTQPKHLELLTVLLNSLPRKISEQKVFELVEVLHNYIERNCFTSINLETNVTLLQRNIIRGLLLLNSTNINKQLKVQKYTTGLVNELMQNFYTTQDNNIIFVSELQETTFEHCVLILKFALTNPNEFKCLVNHLCQPYLVQSMEFNKEVKFGIYLLNAFEEVVLPFLLKNFEYFLELAIEKQNLKLTMELVMFILGYVLKNKSCKQHYNDVSKILIEKWGIFKELFNASGDNVHLGTEYLKLLMPICKSHTPEFHIWLVQRLVQEDDVNIKLQIFYMLVDTVEDKAIKLKDELENGLENLSAQILFFANTNSLIFNKLLNIIPHIKSSIIFKSIIELHFKLLTDTEIAPLLEKFIRNIDESLQQSILTLVYKMSCDEDRAFEQKYKLIRDVMPPLFQKCSLACLEKFYEEHINEIISKLEDTNLEINILGFALVEILFLRIPIGTPERTNCTISAAANNPKLLHHLLKFALGAFKNSSSTSKELLRLYKCYAYNALASIVCNSLKSPNFYEKLFVREENNRDILWSGIIDTSTVFDFPILFDSIPSQRKVLINIRDEIRAQQRRDGAKSKSMKYIESQRLFNSSLSEDVTNFDFTNTILRSEKEADDQNETSINYPCEIQLDAINVNNHECMATVCGLIQHIFNSGVNELPEEGDEVVLPNWMKGMRTTLLSQDTHENIKIFLVKVIDNMLNIFNHYSNWFLEPLMQFVVDKCAGDEINHFVTEVIIILAKWASSTIKLSERESQLASDMLDFLISKLKYERLDVFKYNLDLLKLIVEAWKNYIQVPTDKILQLISTEDKCEIGIHLTSIFLVNNLAPWKASRVNFVNLLLKRMDSTKKAVYRPCAETVGLALRYLENERYVANVDAYLKKIKDFTKYVYCLEGVAIHFPQIVNAYHVAKLISSLNQFPDIQKILHLKIIYRRAEVSLDILDEISDFKIVEWDQLLENANLEIQIITLEIIKKCLSVFMSYKGYINIIKTLLRNISNSNVLYRSCVYDIAILIYQQNKDDLEVCKEILISGLVDYDEGNREKVIEFWKRNSNLPDAVVDRFPYLLSNLYKNKMEDQFLGYVNYFLISILTTDESDVELFDHPLEDCDFEDYKLQTNWRLQHPSVVPLFADTLQTYNDFQDLYDENKLFEIKKTQTTFDFAPTQSTHEQEFSKFTSLESSLSVNVSDSASSIKNPNDLIMSQKYRLPRRRFLKDKSKISISHAHYEVKKQIKKVQQRIDLAKEREKRVNIYRSYRKGDLPDIQIMLSSVLKPLQMLSLHDSEVSKILFLEIFKGLVSKVDKNDLFLQTVSSSIRYIFNNSTYFNSNLFSTLLDILLRNKDKIKFEPQLIAYVCQQSGLVSVGTLLLEEYLISYDDEPSGSKKGPGSEENVEIIYWVKLAELYKELEEWDVVRAIFLEKMNCKDIIQKALKCEAEGQWRGAQDLYKQLIETDISAERKDFYYESYFKSFANLGEWQYLPETINAVVISTDTDNAWDLLWDSGWYQQKLLPWYISAQVKNMLFSQTWPEEFSKDLNKCLSVAEKAEYLQTNFSEELCMMWLFKKDIATAKIYLQSYIKNFLGEWQLLNPMFQTLRYNRVLKLRNFIETDEFITTYNNMSDDFEESFKKLTSRWQNTSSEILPSILLSETRVLYRTLYINLLKEKMSKFELMDLTEPVENLKLTKFNLDIALIETGAELNHYYIPRKYLKQYSNKKNLKVQTALGNLLFLRSNMVSDSQEVIKLCYQALEILGSVFDASQDQSILIPTNIKFFVTASKISQILMGSHELFLEYQTKLSQRFKKPINTPEEIAVCASKILRSSVENIEDDSMDCDDYKASSKCRDIAKAFVKLAYFTRDQNEDELQGDFILYVLRAMKLNSLEAKQLFPCILMQNRLGSDYSRLFILETEKIPTWMFLGWIPQLLANVDSQKIFAISKIIIRIAEAYPQAIMYPYRLSKENYNFTDNNVAEEARFLINSLDKLLLNDEMVDTFLRALSYVSVPASVLRYYVSKMYKSEDENEIKAIQTSIMNDMLSETPESGKVDSMQGNMFKKVGKFKKDFAKMSGNKKKMKDDLKKIDGELVKLLQNEKTSSLLKDYCPWLANFSANRLNIDMEIPGQYDGQKLPLPQHHVKISGFCPNVHVMSSLRKPIKLTILGMDTKEYPFLVKFGEDIRQDQRIQQLFGLMNDIFNSDTSYTCTGLDILTYQVIPLTSNLGIIQWIDETQPLSDFVKKSITDKKALDKISTEYSNWLCKKLDALNGYGMAAIKYSRDKTVGFYRSLVNKIPVDVMKTSFLSLSTNTENFIALRNNFIKSYAVLCTSQWILGIGDRHLNNSLICIRNGKVLGIDFGHAFGTATQILPVPELVPFRLTPHIVSLMEPLKERGQFRESMIHTLRALRINYTSLLATMNVFIEEPSLDWLEHASKFEGMADEKSHNWYPNIKVDQAKRKLQGASSANILIEDLRAGQKVAHYTEAYVKLVKGLTEYDKRAVLVDENLTVENQVDCLIDHATDYNLLGRMYVGWMPFV